jgi:hypothetical protein
MQHRPRTHSIHGTIMMLAITCVLLAAACGHLEDPVPLGPYAPVVTEFFAMPPSIHAGAETTLYWDVDASPHSLITVEPRLDDLDLVYGGAIAPTTTTTFTLTATNEVGTTTATTTVTVVPPLDDDALEPNDTPDTATAVELDYESDALSIVAADLDWFTFTLEAPARVLVDIAASRIGSLLQAVVRVHDADLHLLALFTDGMIFEPHPEPPVPLELAAGTYFVAVHGAGPAYRLHRRSSGAYQLSVVIQP